MMQATKIIISLFFCVPVIASATTDPECLKHLGGAFAGVECYNGLSNDIAAENKILMDKIAATIPKRNKNKDLLWQYERHQMDSKKYCQLSRNSYTGWVTEKHSINPRYYDYDVVYYECIYDILQAQNKFLKNILKNSSQ